MLVELLGLRHNLARTEDKYLYASMSCVDFLQ